MAWTVGHGALPFTESGGNHGVVFSFLCFLTRQPPGSPAGAGTLEGTADSSSPVPERDTATFAAPLLSSQPVAERKKGPAFWPEPKRRMARELEVTTEVAVQGAQESKQTKAPVDLWALRQAVHAQV